MKKRTLYAIASTLTLSAIITSCGSSSSNTEETTTEETTTEEIVEEATTTISGSDLFTSSGCVACHQPETKTVGPGINEIAAAYAGNKDGLVKFLNGEGEAIVDPAQAAVMQPQTEVTKKMTAEERNALADHLLSK